MDDKSEGSVDGLFFIDRIIYSAKELSMRKQNNEKEHKDQSAERYIEFSWRGDSDVVIREEDAEILLQPETTVVRIKVNTPRKHVLKALYDINWFVQNSWPEKFHTWADLVEFERDKNKAAPESHQRGERILSEFTKELSKEDLRCVEEAMRSYVDYINYYNYYLPK